jgi:Core-2/I-Branching enzyme
LPAPADLQGGQRPVPASVLPPRISALVLCHESPATVARRLSAPFFRHPDVATYIHYDGARSAAHRAELRAQLPADGRYRFVDHPVHCQWGDHTLVEATRRMINLALADQAFAGTHLALISASCVPYRPVSSLQRFIAERPGIEFIQAQDISAQRWIKDGLERERYEYYFPFNFRTRRRWFEWLTDRQREFGIRRRVPQELKIHFGSQWFCLTRDTAAHVASRLAEPAIRRWLRWCWIPDEFAIQTLVAEVCPRSHIAGHNLTYYEFDDQGMPLVLENGHYQHLLSQPFFFARKLAPEARTLEAAVVEHASKEEADHSYFDRVGRATSAYARRMAEVKSGTATQAHVGTSTDAWRGAMATNQRRYYVLHAASAGWLRALVQHACTLATPDLPLFELPFDTNSPPVRSGECRLGIRSTDRARRDHDPQAFLFEIVNAHPDQPCAFGLDISRPGRIRDFVRWDAPAVLIDCNPPLSREQRAATLLDNLLVADDAPVIQAVLDAMRSGKALPDEAFCAEVGKSAACQVATLSALGPELGDRTLLALRGAYHALDPALHHVEAGAAWRRFWK